MPGYGSGTYGSGPYGVTPYTGSPTGSPASWSSQEITWDSLVATWSDLAPPRAPEPTRLDVGVWEHLSGSTWGKVGEVRTWQAFNVEPRFNDIGQWSMTIPRNEQALSITKTRLVTFGLVRDGTTTQLMTGFVETPAVGKGETGSAFVEVSGMDTLGYLDQVLVHPTPPGVGEPPVVDGGKQRDAYWTRVGRTETLLREVVTVNWKTRLGLALNLGPDQGRGIANTHLHERFSNLLPLLTRKCEAAGLGVRMGLVPTGSSARAELTLEFYEPTDKSQRVRLSHRVGSLRTWKQTDNRPKVTRAFVAGGGQGVNRIYLERRDAAAEAEWGGVPREVFVDSRGTSDIDELTESALDALAEGGSQSGFELEAVEAVGIRYGQHFNLGDTVAVEILDDLSRTDKLRAVQVEGGSGGINIKLVPGLPDAGDPLFQQAQIIRQLRRELRALQREEG